MEILLPRAAGLRFSNKTVIDDWSNDHINEIQMLCHFFSYIPISLVGIQVTWTHGLYYYPETYPKISDFLAFL